MRDTTTVTARVERDVRQKCERLAAANGRSLSAEVAKALATYVADKTARGTFFADSDVDALIATTMRFKSDEADGPNLDSVQLHVRAEQYLAERGKRPGTYTDLEYVQACDAVEKAA